MNIIIPKPIVRLEGFWRIVGRYPDGSVKFIEEIHNLVVNEGLNDILDVYFRSGTQTATASWYIFCTTGSPSPLATHTMATGPTEWTGYTGNRPAWGQDAVSSQSISNSTAVTFTSNADTQTVGGCGLTTTNTGTTGTLFNYGAFSGGNKSLDTSETIDVTCTINATSS